MCTAGWRSSRRRVVARLTENRAGTPLILPKIDWSAPTNFNLGTAAQEVGVSHPVAVSSSAMPGFTIQLPSGSPLRGPSTGTLQVAELPASEAAQHMPQGTSGPMLLYKVTGLNMADPVQLTMPNTSGYQPGAVVSLMTFNPLTGGHDVVGQMVVSADGQTVYDLKLGDVTLTTIHDSNSGHDRLVFNYQQISLTTTPEYFAKEKSVCEAMTVGLAEGVKFALLNPQETIEILFKELPELKLASTAKEQLDVGIGVWSANQVTKEAMDKGIGYADPAVYSKMTDLIFEAGAAAGDKKPDPAALFTNEFVGKLKLSDAEWAKVKSGSAKYALG